MAELDRHALNCALAEHLFGWRWCMSHVSPAARVLLPPKKQAGRVPWDGDPTILIGGSGVVLGSGIASPRVPDYAGTWKGMGQVIDVMREEGWYPQLSASQFEWRPYGSALCRHWGIAEEDSLPFACALAALRAIVPDVAEKLEGRE